MLIQINWGTCGPSPGVWELMETWMIFAAQLWNILQVQNFLNVAKNG